MGAYRPATRSVVVCVRYPLNFCFCGSIHHRRLAIDLLLRFAPYNGSSRNAENDDAKRRRHSRRIQKWRGRRYHRLLTRVPIDDGVGQRVSNRRIRPRERSHRGSVDARLRGFELVYLTPCILLATKRVRIRVGRILS